MAALNLRLARPPEFDLTDSDRLGLFVVSRLAARQQVKVLLRASGYSGTLAVVLLPPALVVSEEETVFLAAAAARAVPADAAADRQESPMRPPAGRSPEQARALLSSIRQGWRGGLADARGTDGTLGQDTAQDRDER
jgi:hypothetical protein